MLGRTQHRQSVQHHSNIDEVCDALCGILIQFARKYLYIRTDRKAVFHLLAVFLLSLFAAFVSLPDHYYFVKKNNILNSCFVKLGWFWTCVVVCPFIWYISTAVGQGMSGIIQNLSRMVIATTIWYYCTHAFVTFEQITGHCRGSKLSSRTSCAADGGKWVPGFDISGHCFILIYSSLIICEEALAFRTITVTHRTRGLSLVKNENRIRIFFICMCALHLLWDFELLISVLYYHHIYHKVMGALIAVLCWYFTYHVWYRRVGIPPLPLQSQKMK
uniref:FIT family protein n=1 Tax=Elaeophora elaphi TaxID=1147741 RepID=A0A0R3RFM6_9BILA